MLVDKHVADQLMQRQKGVPCVGPGIAGDTAYIALASLADLDLKRTVISAGPEGPNADYATWVISGSPEQVTPDDLRAVLYLIDDEMESQSTLSVLRMIDWDTIGGRRVLCLRANIVSGVHP